MSFQDAIQDAYDRVNSLPLPFKRDIASGSPDIEWLEALLEDLYEGLPPHGTGKSRTCVHVDLNVPQPVSFHAWNPKVLYCPDCASLYGPNPPVHHLCNRCHKKPTGEGKIGLVCIQVGIVMCMAVLCLDCMSTYGPIEDMT